MTVPLRLEQLESRLLLSRAIVGPEPPPDPAPQYPDPLLAYIPEPAVLKTGIDYTYYEGNYTQVADFDPADIVKTGTETAFEIDQRSGGVNNYFAFMYEGYIDIATAGDYTFYTNSDDGSLLFINSGLVVDNDGLHGEEEESGLINLPVGKHEILVYYFERTGSEVLEVSWSGPGIAKEIIPADVLYRDAPAPPTPDLEAGSDTGAANDDNITYDTTPTFSAIAGTVPNDATVYFRVNGVVVDSATTADGSYSFTLVPGDLNEGPNSVDVFYADDTGDPFGDSDNLTVTLDTTLATPAPPDLRDTSDTGDSDTDNLTSDNAAWFDGYAEPGATVRLFVGAAGKDSATANAATGAYAIQLDPGDLAAGPNNITVTVTDTAGNSTSSAALVVTYDAAGAVPNAPDLQPTSDSGAANDDNITFIDTATIFGSLANGNPVEAGATVHVRVNPNPFPDNLGFVEVGAAIADANGNWSYTFDGVDDLTEGANRVEIYIVDIANNTSGYSNELTITIDTAIANPALAPDLAAGSDSGSADDDNITSDTTPTFTGPNGSVEANCTVQIRVDGSVVKTTTADGNGAYSVTLDALPDGAYIIDIVTFDTAGNTSNDSPNLTLTLDTAAPAPTVAPDLASGSDTGDSNSDDLTKQPLAVFTAPAGSVPANATVTMRVDAANAETAAANADGSFSITLGAGDLTEGNRSIDFYYTDLAGNVSGFSPALPVELDVTVADPALPDLTDASDTGTANNDDITSETRPTIQGLAGAVEADSTVLIWLDTPSAAGALVGTTTALGDGSWSYTFTAASPLEEGVNEICIAAVDPAGNFSNASPSLFVTVNFDTGAIAPPDLATASDSGDADNDDLTNISTPAITGPCPAGSAVKVRVNGSTIFTFTDNDADDDNPAAGAWSFEIPGATLATGPNTIDYLTIDTNKNTSDWSLNLVVTLDASTAQPTKPNLATADDSGSNSGDDLTNVATPTLTGTAEPGSTLTINCNAGADTDTAVVAADGTWSFTLPGDWLNEGANDLFVTATDPAGNTSVASATLTVTLDTTIAVPSTPDLTAATDTGASNSDNTTSHANPRIVGTADPNTTITVRLDPAGAATVVGTTTADGAGNWAFTFPAAVLAEGTNVIDVVATDLAGNSDESLDLTIEYETTIATPADLDLTDASDLGDADDDNLTSLSAAIITGTADASVTIFVRVNGEVVGFTTSDLAGDWSYTFDGVDDLVEGSNSIDAYAEDAVGNISPNSPRLTVILDTSIAVPTAPDLLAASDTGTLDFDNYTSDTTPTLRGSCEPGATITLRVNGAPVAPTITDNDLDGQWEVTLAGGILNADPTGQANTIEAKQTDPAGNESAYGAALTLTLDTTAQTPAAPDLDAATDTGDANDDNLTNASNPIIRGSVESASALEIYLDTGAGPNLLDTISESLIASGAWSYTFSMGQLIEGDNTITVIAIDKAGNTSPASAPLTITLDTTVNAPSLPDLATSSDTGDVNDDDVTSDNTPTFTGTADPFSHVTLRVNGQPINTVDADAAGDWSYTFALGEIQSGVRQIDAIATDPAGNTSSLGDDLTIWLNVMPTQPARPDLAPSSDSGHSATDNLTYITTPTIEGKADPGNTVHVYVDTVWVGQSTSNAEGFWTYDFLAGELAEGLNSVTIITEDASGLLSGESFPLELTIDTIAPTPDVPDLQPSSDTGVSNSDNYTSDATPTIDGLTDPAANVQVFLADTLTATLTANAEGYWSYTFAPSALLPGSNLIYVVVTDPAGNVADPSPTLTLTLDTLQEAPDAPTLDPDSDSGTASDDRLTNRSDSNISGIVKPLSTVQVLVAGQPVATVAADDAGQWQYTFLPGQLAEGENTVEILSTDTVGNVARSAALELTLDTIAPVFYNYFPADVHTHTTSTIELYVAGSDLDPLAAIDTTGYLLLGSGSDGSFDDGNEWVIPISDITVDPVSGLIELHTAVTLTDDTYRLTILPDTSLHDLAGNPVQMTLSSHGLDASVAALDSAPIEITFEIDTAGPPAPSPVLITPDSDSGASNADAITNLRTPTVRLSAQPETTVEILCNGRSAGFATEYAPGLYELTLLESLVREGENLLLARAFDAQGNASDLSELSTFTYDPAGPEVAAIVLDSLYVNLGPASVSIVFASPDVDPASLSDLANFRLLASGNDASFNDGNEIQIPILSVVHQPATHTLVLTFPSTPTGASQLTPDTYQLSVLTGQSITDLAGNPLATSATAEFRVVPALTLQKNQRRRFDTPDGPVLVSLVGPGAAQVLLGRDVDSNNTIERIVLTDTTADSRLIIRPLNGSQTTVGQILADSPLQAILAPKVVLTDQLQCSGVLASLRIGDIADDADLDITTSDNSLRVQAGSIGQNVSFDVTGRLAQLSAASFASGSLSADSIGSISLATGHCAADIIATAGSLDALTLRFGDLTGNLDIAGSISRLLAPTGSISGSITANDIGLVRADSLLNATLRADNDIALIRANNADGAHLSAGHNLARLNLAGDLRDSTVAAGADLLAVTIRGDALDSLLLAGANLGHDAALDGQDDSFSDGALDLLVVRGRYESTTAAAAVNPGDDLAFFTADDAQASTGHIHRVRFGRDSLGPEFPAVDPYGLIAATAIDPLRYAGQLLTPPTNLGPFHLALVP